MSRKDDLWAYLGEATRTGKPTGDILREYWAEMSGKDKPADPPQHIAEMENSDHIVQQHEMVNKEEKITPPRQGVTTVDAKVNKHYDFELCGTGMLESEWIKEHGDVFKKGER
jgi:hypothetical protein